MTTKGTIESVLESFSKAFVNALTATITQTIGSPWSIAAVPGTDVTPDQSEPIRIGFRLEGSMSGGFLLEIPRADAALLAAQILSEAADEFGTEQSDALLKCIQAAAGEFCSAAVDQYGAFTIQASMAAEPAPELANVFHAEVGDHNSNRVSLLMILNPALMESLALRSDIETTIAEARISMKSAAGKSVQETANLKLVMDVELNVTLRFGQRQLTLREVLDLTSGSVIELDRQVEGPVELLLDGRVIARGEAVVIDGNYGLRVTEVSEVFSSRSSIRPEVQFMHTESLNEDSLKH